MNADEFEDRLQALRPRLHRYCARMTGSAVTGEDVLQDTLVKALHARAQGAGVRFVAVKLRRRLREFGLRQVAIKRGFEKGSVGCVG